MCWQFSQIGQKAQVGLIFFQSLFRRITDSIKDVLRPSWLANDNDDVPAVPEVAGTSVADDGEECVVVSVELHGH